MLISLTNRNNSFDRKLASSLCGDLRELVREATPKSLIIVLTIVTITIIIMIVMIIMIILIIRIITIIMTMMLGIHQRGVQSEGGAVDGASII